MRYRGQCYATVIIIAWNCGMPFPQVKHVKYPHRYNPDGTTDSICPRCFMTIGTSIWESELEEMEASHVCDADQFERFEDEKRNLGRMDHPGAAERRP
jgi:hypothetical protein